MSRVAPYFVAFMLPPLVVFAIEVGGFWSIGPALLMFVAIPVLDTLLDLDTHNPEPGQRHDWRFDIPLLLWVPVQVGLTAWALWRLSTGEFSTGTMIGATVSLGLANGAGGINIAHELMHRKTNLHRAGAEILMTSVSYTHFCVEHVLGHHRNVATEADAASSRLNESFYRFYPRVLVGSLVSAWRLERARCAKRGIPWTSLRDRRTRYSLVIVAVYLGIALALGPVAVAVFAAQGVVAFTLLEAINYIEHYGLSRRRLDGGGYERVRPQHSWNSAHRASNWYLFNLARHSDHHYLASREYDRLRHWEDAPQLPAGYGTMVLVGLVPPLWFRIMNPRVEAWRRAPGA